MNTSIIDRLNDDDAGGAMMPACGELVPHIAAVRGAAFDCLTVTHSAMELFTAGIQSGRERCEHSL